MLISQSGSPDFLIVFFLQGAEDEVMALAGFSDSTEDRGILLDAGGTPDDKRDGEGVRELFRESGGLLRGSIETVRVGTDQLEADSLSAELVDAQLSPGQGVLDDGLEGFKSGRRPVGGRRVPDLHSQYRPVRERAFKEIEGEAILAADGDLAAGVAQIDLFDPSVIDCLRYL
jgi:hypothetical protein